MIQSPAYKNSYKFWNFVSTILTLINDFKLLDYNNKNLLTACYLQNHNHEQLKLFQHIKHLLRTIL